MRDTHRMREKYDLSLDSRQVVSLLIGGIVVLGAVFVLGVLVGKKLAGTPHTDRAPDLLTALDHKSDALERARAAPPLTFQEELTKPASAAPTAIRPPTVSAPATAPAASPTSPSASGHASPASTTAAGTSPAASAPASAPSKPATVARAAAVPVTTTPSTDAKPEPEKIATRSTPAAAHPAPKVPDTTSASGAFTLQLGASPNRDDAERQASRLREKGYAPYIVAAEVPGKGTWYRVRMGSFPTKDAATRYLQDFKRETQAEAFVASTR
jgi:cell division septation protein DedD